MGHVLNIHGVNDVRLDPYEAPRPGNSDVLVKVKACGVCGSDLSYIKIGGIMRKPGGVTPIGHEAAGEVIAVGHDVKNVSVGQRVVINPMMTPSAIGSGGPEGAFTEELLVRDARIGDNLLPIPNDLPFDVAAMTEPLAVALHGVNRMQVKPGDKAVVFGCGPIGLGMVAGARAKSPAHVIALDMAPQKLELAKECGADIVINIASEDAVAQVMDVTDGYGADVYLEGTGHPSAVIQGLNLLRKLGTYVEYGVFGSDVTVDWSIISDDKELNVLGAHLGPYCWPAAIRMIESGVLPMDKICTHQLPLAEFQKGLDLVSGGTESVKVSLIP